MHDDAERIRSTRLANGMLIITESMPGMESAALGVWADAGSEDEASEEFGAAHFLEHMLFKGTATRTAFDLAEAIEDVGGQLNAYTERETTHLSAHVLAEHLPVAVALLADMVCHSTFPPDELDRERQVIVEEIHRYESLPDERIHDLFMEGLYHGGRLGHAILGTESSVRALSREAMLACWRRHFSAERVILTAAGKVDHDTLVAQITEQFAAIPPAMPMHPALPLGAQQPLLIETDDDIEQVSFCWGGRTYPAGDARYFPLAILDATLGASTTSRLFQEVREKRGLAYEISSYTIGFRDTGTICATGAASPAGFTTMLSLVREQLDRLRADGITPRELARAKEQMKAGMALSMEGTLDRMSRLAQHQLTWGQVYPLGYLIDQFTRVTLADVQQVIDEVLDPARWTFTAIGPIDEATIRHLVQPSAGPHGD